MIEVNIALQDMLLINEAMKKADSNEIGGFGTIMYTESDVPYVSHLYIPRQTISAGEVDWGMDGVLDYINYLNEQGDTRTRRGLFSWHSHNNMSTFWSTTDESFIQLAGSEGVPYIFSIVLNNKGERLERLDVFSEHHCGLIEGSYMHTHYDETEVDLVTYESNKITKKREELDEVHDELDAEMIALEEKQKEERQNLKDSFSGKIEDASKKVNNHVNSLRGDAKKHVEDIWDERITEKISYTKWGWESSYGRGLGHLPPVKGYLDSTADEILEVDDIVAEIGDAIMYFDYDNDADCFVDVTYVGMGRETISIDEARGNFVDVYVVDEYKIKNVSVFEYLMSNYDLDPKWGQYELVATQQSPADREFWEANAASMA